MTPSKHMRMPRGLRVFGIPILIGALTLAGLLSALLLGHIGRYFAWGALALPLAVIVRAFIRRS